MPGTAFPEAPDFATVVSSVDPSIVDKLNDARAEAKMYEKSNDTRHDSIAVVSGGLDSTTLVHRMINEGYTPHLLSFNYGQRHSKELNYARTTATLLGLRHDIVDLTGITRLISNSALTSQTGLTVRGMNFDGDGFHPNIEVPEGHYAEDTMKATVVPNRNMIMLSIAAGAAVNFGYRTIGFGVHGGDHFIYPDCRPKFIFAVGQTILDGNEGFHNFWVDRNDQSEGALPVYTPYLKSTKADIAYEALLLGVPLHLTWSCYKGGDIHCGRCGTCVERLEAIDEAQERIAKNPPEDWDSPYRMEDHTEYADTEFWRTAVREGTNS